MLNIVSQYFIKNILSRHILYLADVITYSCCIRVTYLYNVSFQQNHTVDKSKIENRSEYLDGRIFQVFGFIY